MTYLVISNIRPEYSFITKAVSELGSLDAPNKWAWNILGYIVPGILISVYSFGLYKNIAPENSSKLPLIVILLRGIFMSFSGIFSGDFNNRQSTTMLLHTLGSLGSYLFFLIGAFTFPRQMKKSSYWKSAIKSTLIFTWLTILFGSWVFIFPGYPAVGQRIVFIFYFSWIVFTAYKLYVEVEEEKQHHL
jgi:hypothetical membrane protein